MDVDVFAFGITADFRTRLFPGSQRLVELADRVQVLQVEALCWCGARATHNARTVDGVMVVEGEQVVVGDTGGRPATGQVDYEVLCRRHHMRRMTAQPPGRRRCRRTCCRSTSTSARSRPAPERPSSVETRRTARPSSERRGLYARPAEGEVECIRMPGPNRCPSPTRLDPDRS